MQGYGYGKEAINGLINYSKEVLNFKELIAVIFLIIKRVCIVLRDLAFRNIGEKKISR